MLKEELIEAFKILSRKSDPNYPDIDEVDSIFREYRRLLTFVTEDMSSSFYGLSTEVGNIKSSLNMAHDYKSKGKPVKTKEKLSEAARWLHDDINHAILILEMEN